MPISMAAVRRKCEENVESVALFRAHNGPAITVGVLVFMEAFAVRIIQFLLLVAHFQGFS